MSRGIENVLADCLDRVYRGEATVEEALRAHPELRSELEPLLLLAEQLRWSPRIRAPKSLRTTRRPDFRDRGKAAPIDLSAWRAGPGARRLPGWVTPLARLAAGLAAAFLLFGGTMAASAGSLPEEPLYPVKLAVESAQLALAPSPEARVELQLQFASRRLEEVESAARQGKTEAVQRGLALYTERVEAALQAAPEAAGAESARGSQSPLEQQQEVLNRVYNQVPAQAQPAILHALEVSGRDRSGESGGNALPAPPATAVQTPGPTSTAAPSIAVTLPDAREEGKDRGNSGVGRQTAEDRGRDAKAEGQEKPGSGPDSAEDSAPAARGRPFLTPLPSSTASPAPSAAVPTSEPTVVPDSTGSPGQGRGKDEKAGEPDAQPAQLPQAPEQPARDRGGDSAATRSPATPKPTATRSPATPTPAAAAERQSPNSGDRERRDGSSQRTDPATGVSGPNSDKNEQDRDTAAPKSTPKPTSVNNPDRGPLDAALAFLAKLLGQKHR